MSDSSNTVAIVAVAVTGAVSLVGTVGNWVYQARSERRRFERERVAADLDELRALLDEGARALTRYDETRAALLHAAWRRASVSPDEDPDGAEEARGQFWAAHEANRAAHRDGDDIELRLLIRLGRREVVAAFGTALVYIAADSAAVPVERVADTDDPVLTDDHFNRRYEARGRYLREATSLVGSPLGALTSGRWRRARSTARRLVRRLLRVVSVPGRLAARQARGLRITRRHGNHDDDAEA